MKKIFTLIILTIFLLISAVPCFTQGNGFLDDQTGKKAAISLGAEWNMNARNTHAGGAVLAFDYSFKNIFAVGINATASTNFSGIVVVEPAAFFRWYFVQRIGFFLQADAGAYLLFENKEMTTIFLGGVRLGLRIRIGETFFLEPYGRVGYPFMFGIGLMAGVRF